MVIRGKVYDVSAFLDDHPGGEEVLREHAAKNATLDFEDVGHSAAAQELMKDFCIGDLADTTSTEGQNPSQLDDSQLQRPTSKLPFFGLMTTLAFLVLLGAISFFSGSH